MTDAKPLIIEILKNNIQYLNHEIRKNQEFERYINQSPVIYLFVEKKRNNYSVYVGETNNIKRRINEHLEKDGKLNKYSKIFIIGNKYFNKSLTLDIEDRLMSYLTSVNAVIEVDTGRGNPQNLYHGDKNFNVVLSAIWEELGKRDKKLFPQEILVKNSAIFKASPFHKLTKEQNEAKDNIISKVEEGLCANEKGRLILVQGEAGTGKTVLMSHLFYDLYKRSKDSEAGNLFKENQMCLLVNHGEQLKVYEQIAIKLGIKTASHPLAVSNPTTFINQITSTNKVDVIIVDEAHLLWTQGRLAYQGKNQFDDLLERAKVVIAIFDKNQVLSTECYWEEEKVEELIERAKSCDSLIELKQQCRINAQKRTVNWIRNIVDRKKIGRLHEDKKYQIKVFESPERLFDEIKYRSEEQKLGLSRVIATYDWDYKKGRKTTNDYYWEVDIEGWKKPWNFQLPSKRGTKKFPWAEQVQTIDEIGSTFSIQGFDLNFVGVIIGPSVKYERGSVVFDPSASKNQKAIRNRKFANGQRGKRGEELLKNELNVLLTRGVNGLYLYAVDKALRDKLLEVQEQRDQR
ncbi:MAG: DUF2075 domain-containing protein [Turicibacter sp.]|nr:DUF2075 domain-containing protein [Turicibacter sp.]